MRLTLQEKPLAKARHRLSKYGYAYDPQSPKKQSDKWAFKSQMIEKGICKLSKHPLRASLTFGVPTRSKRSGSPLNGLQCISTPDIDNYIKYYLDVLNGIAYEDDSHITQIWAEKVYADIPSVEINITPMEGDMIQEHAKTIQGEINLSDLEYMVKKAHRIGLSGRNLVRVYAEEDGEGKHIYFECESMKEKELPSKIPC